MSSRGASVWFFVAALTSLLFAWGCFRLAGNGKAIATGGRTSDPLDRMNALNYLRPAYLVIPAMMFLSGVACMPAQNYLVALVRDELGYGVTYLLLAASFAAFVDHRSLTVIYFGAALFGLAFNAIFSLIPAYVSLSYPSQATALIFGIGNVMLGLGAMTGNFLGGLIKDQAGSFQLIYGAALTLAVLLTFIAIFLREPNSP